MPTVVSAYAPAKINLTLEVLRKRPDGYHDITSIVQTIDVWDHLTCTEAPEITLECDVQELEGEDNLAFKAARLLADETKTTRGVLMHLHKEIPTSAGLGGGSTDAAAALLALNELWGTNLPHEKLSGLAARLGSDVPFFLTGGTALATGRGEHVTPLPPLTETWFVLLMPEIPLRNKTAAMYQAVTHEEYTDGEATEDAIEYLKRGRAIPANEIVNTFEKVAYRMFRGLDRHAGVLQAASGDDEIRLAGAGPTLFCVVPTQARGEAIVQALARRSERARCVRSVQQGVRIEVTKA